MTILLEVLFKVIMCVLVVTITLCFGSIIFFAITFYASWKQDKKEDEI